MEENENLPENENTNPNLDDNLNPIIDLSKPESLEEEFMLSTPKITSEMLSEEIPAAPSPNFQFESNLDIGFVRTKVNETRIESQKYIIGQTELIDLLLVGVFTNGHVLLEGVPGIAKTLAVKVISKCLDTNFSRIQFTPDLMPSDVIGTSVFNMKTSEFSFHRGPIFSNIILIDEINRAPAKTQAALFEVMEERQVTFEGIKYKMDFPFLIISTQNPIEQEGTYSLPEAQLDRFLFKIVLNYPTLEEETQILERYKNTNQSPSLDLISPTLKSEDILKIQGIISEIKIEDNLLKYIAKITHSTRNHGKLYLGASPRATLSMAKAAKAIAAIRGRDFITPDDIQSIAHHVLNHRIMLTPEAEMEGLTSKDIVTEIIHKIEVPR